MNLGGAVEIGTTWTTQIALDLMSPFPVGITHIVGHCIKIQILTPLWTITWALIPTCYGKEGPLKRQIVLISTTN